MRILAFHHTHWQIIVHIALSYLTIQFINEAEAKLGHVGWAKSDLRTKQILQNIRNRLAEREAQETALSECGEDGMASCPVPMSDEEDDADQIPAILRFKDHHGQKAPHKPKDFAALKDNKFIKKTDHKEVSSSKKHEKKPNDSEFKSKLKKLREEDEIISRNVQSGKKTEVRMKQIVETTKDSDKTGKIEKTKKSGGPQIVKKEDLGKSKKLENEDRTKREVRFRLQPQPIMPRAEGTEKVKTEKKTVSKDKSTTVKLKGMKKSTQKEGEKTSASQKDSAGFPKDIPVVLLTADNVKSEQCREHSQIYQKQLHKYKLWALMMYDASAKLPSGILQGNINQYGDFDQCISVNATFKKGSRHGASGIQGKYCMAAVDVSSSSNNAALQHAIYRSQSYGFVESSVNDPGHFIPRFTTINWGVCIPSSCHAEDLEIVMQSSLDKYKKNSGLNFDVRVDDKNCITKEDLVSQRDTKTLLTLLLYCIVIGISIYATIKDAKKAKDTHTIKQGANPEIPLGVGNSESEAPPDEKSCNEDRHGSDSSCLPGLLGSRDNVHQDLFYNKIFVLGKLRSLIMAFSLKRNAKLLFIEGESKDSIDCIHGIKSIITMMLYFAHKTIPLSLTPFNNRVVLTEISNEAISVIFRGSIIYTDSFLLISGVLTAFNLCKEIKINGRISWIRRIIARYIRLTPALLATLLFYAYVSSDLGSGPMWNPIVKQNSVLCQNYMWRNLLYVQNFYPFEKMCAPQTHQLALDMQLFLLSPLFVYLLHEYDKIGIGILQALLMLSSILRFTSTKYNQLSVFVFHGMPVSQLYKTANLLYSQPLYRGTPYIFGVIVGYYLRKVGKEFRIPNPVVVLGWIMCICLGIISFLSPSHLAYRHYKYDADEAAHYAALVPLSWSAALGWCIAACYLGYGGKLNEYLCSTGLLIFSRISYSVYLIQFLVFSHRIGIIRAPETFSVSGSLDIMEFSLVIILSVSMTLLFDIPTVKIKKLILDELGVLKENNDTMAEETDRVDTEKVQNEYQEATPKVRDDYYDDELNEAVEYDGEKVDPNYDLEEPNADLQDEEDGDIIEDAEGIEFEEDEDELNYDQQEGEEYEEEEEDNEDIIEEPDDREESYNPKRTELEEENESEEVDFWAENARDD